MQDYEVYQYPKSRLATFDVIDSAPAARFTNKLVKNIEEALCLEENNIVT